MTKESDAQISKELGLELEKSSLENELLVVSSVSSVSNSTNNYNSYNNNNNYYNYNKIKYISNSPKLDYLLLKIKEGIDSLKDLHLVYCENIEEISYQNILMQVSRKDSSKSLVSLGYVKAERGLYSITDKGLDYLDSLIKEFDLKQQQEYNKRKQEEAREKEAVFRVQFFKDLVSDNYKAQLFNSKNKKTALEIDYNLVLSLNPDVAMGLLDEPDNYLKAIIIAINQIDEEYSDVFVTFVNLPDSCIKTVGNITHTDKEKLVKVKGIISSAGIPSPNCKEITFECPSCGVTVKKRQLEKTISQVKKCSNCGYKGNFTQINKEYKTIQILKLEEHGEDIGDKAMPSSIHIILEEPLTNSIYQSIYNAGSNIEVIGIVGIEQPDKKKTFAFLVLDAINVKADDEKINLNISEEEEKEFSNITESSDYIKKLIPLFASDLAGMDRIKESLIIQAVSISSEKPLHVLLVGDPAKGKSEIAERLKGAVPRSRKASNTSSSAGLTYSISKNELNGEFSLKAGALPLANNSVCLIDELDKFNKDDLNTLHEALAQGNISVNKAGIHSSLKCHTSVIATANPKYGKFDLSDEFIKQIDMPSSLLDRFGLVWIIVDDYNEEETEQIALKIMNRFSGNSEYNPEKIAKYIHKAKQYNPKLTKESQEHLASWYKGTKKKSITLKQNNKATPYISNRSFETIVQLSLCYAKLRFSNKCERKDCDKAIELFQECLLKAKEVDESLFNHLSGSEINVKEKKIISKIKPIISDDFLTFNEIICYSDIEDISPKDVKAVLQSNIKKEWSYKSGKYKAIFYNLSKEEVI